MINIDLQGDTQLIAKLEAMPGKLQTDLTKRITTLALQLQAAVKQKLSGQVLKVGSGNLRDSIGYDVVTAATAVTGTVFSDITVKYARIQEYGGTTRPHVIEPRAGGVLAFQIGGKTVFARRVNHPGSKIPARPFMRPTLAEYRDRIVTSMNQAVAESLK
jgi:HK97 gp10 family phage protein